MISVKRPSYRKSRGCGLDQVADEINLPKYPIMVDGRLWLQCFRVETKKMEMMKMVVLMMPSNSGKGWGMDNT